MSRPSEPTPIGHRYSDVVQVFEPNSLAFPPLDEYVAKLLDRREFIKELARAEVRGQRSNTFFGELWSLIDPVFQASIYLFLFLVIRGSAGRSAEFVTAIIGSVFFFNYTRISISEGGRAIMRSKGLVLNAIFPRALLPIAEVYKGFLSTIPALVLYVPIHLVAGAPITSAIFMLPLLLTIQSGLNLGMALLFSTATAFFADIANLISYVVRVLMFSTPIIYPVTLLSPTVRSVLSWNPFFAVFSAYQAIITGNTPSAGLIFQGIAWSVVIFGSGVWVFLRHERSFGLHI